MGSKAESDLKEPYSKLHSHVRKKVTSPALNRFENHPLPLPQKNPYFMGSEPNTGRSGKKDQREPGGDKQHNTIGKYAFLILQINVREKWRSLPPNLFPSWAAEPESQKRPKSTLQGEISGIKL